MSHGLYQSASSNKSSDNDPFFHVVERFAIREASDNLSRSMGSNLVNQSSNNSSAHSRNESFNTTDIQTITESINHHGNLLQNQVQLNLDNAVSYSGNECGLNNNNKYQLFIDKNHQPVTPSYRFSCSCWKNFAVSKSSIYRGFQSEPSLNFPSVMGPHHSKHIESCFKHKEISSILRPIGDEIYEMEIENLRNQLKLTQEELNEKNIRIEELQREINKLTSVLDQTQISLESNDMISSVNSIQNRSKKQGVSGESNKDQTNLKLIKYKKSNSIKSLLRESILKNLLLSNLPTYQVDEMIEYMYERQIDRGCYVIIEGEEGDHLYVAESGDFEVWKAERLLCYLDGNRCFGELALLYNCRRTASVKALTDAKLWVLDREVFQAIMMRTGIQRQEELLRFLKSVPLLKGLPEIKLNKLVELLELQRHEEGECIIRQGESADCFFIIQSGSREEKSLRLLNSIDESQKLEFTIGTCTEYHKVYPINLFVKVTQRYDGEEQVIRILSMGEYFGEKALLSAEMRTANVYANSPVTDVLCLYRKPFLELIGDLNELKNKNYEDEKHLLSKSSSKVSICNDAEMEKLVNVKLKDLELVCTLGVGGFGRVELVRLSHDHQSTYALKCMKKYHIVQTKQQDHVISEKKILLECRSIFICRLYNTFKDVKFVYMLTEVCLGGELWTCLRDKIHFDDIITKFCLGCVLEAFDYLHSRGIIYRDLKPENLLITTSGYLKLCDFGFAKKIGIGKRTWTFCGTPEYVSPEIILNKSHDFTSDYWSVGILTYELLTGTPPFTGNDPMKIYTLILKGIEATDIFHNRRITFRASSFIQALCKFNAAERLGNGAGGLEEIKSHKYFQGFDWESIRRQDLVSPFHPKVTSSTDHSNFDDFQDEDELPPDEYSGWDEEF